MPPTQRRLVVALVVTVLCLPLLALDLLGGHGGGTSQAADVRTDVPAPSMVVAVSPSEVTTSSESTTSSTEAPASTASTASTSTAKATTATTKAPPKPSTTTTAPKRSSSASAPSSSSAKAPAPAPAAAAPAPAAAPPTTSGSTPSASEAAFLSCVRYRESRGDYTVVDATGTYMGAYQIYQGGWDNVARSIGRSDLVGVRPNTASPADQDAVALAMLRQYGRSPWGGACG